MIGPFFVLSFVGLSLFYLQNLALFPLIQLRLLSLLVFYVSLRPPLALAFALAVFLGIVQDSFALTPLGLHVSGALAMVAAGRYARRRFLVASPGAQILATAAALTAQEAALRLTLVLVGYRDFLVGNLSGLRGLEIVFTAVMAPFMFALLKAVERLMKRWGWRLAGAGSR